MNRPKFNNTSVTVIVSAVFAAFLFLLPTGFEGALQFRDAVKCRALVEAVDNSRIIDTGLIRTGQQVCSVRFLNGKFKGMTHGNQFSKKGCLKFQIYVNIKTWVGKN